jgi:hypothetical protein
MRADVWRFVRPEIIKNRSWGSEDLPPAAILAAIQQDAIAGIKLVREGEWWDLQEGIGYGIARMGERLIRGSRSGTFEDLFRAAAMDTVQTFWERLHECPRCHAMFLKVGKQKFCTPACASRAHTDAFRKRHPDRDHHAEHERRVKRRLGAN